MHKPFAVRKNKLPQQRTGAKTKPTVAALNTDYLHFL